MKYLGVLLAAVALTVSVARTDDPPTPISISDIMPVESTEPVISSAPSLPVSITEKDPDNPLFRIYDNRIVKVHLRVKADWTMMEFKEAENSGTVSFTVSRIPLVTFAVVRAPLQGPFDSYVETSALTPLYPKIQKRTTTTLAGRKGVLIRGILEDGRQDESHFSTDGQSFFRVSFSAPPEAWSASEKQYAAIKTDFRWLK